MINFGALQGGGFQNALAMGMRFGQVARQRQDEREYKNALAQFDPSNPETLKPVMAANPEVGLKLGEQVREHQEAARKSDMDGLEKFRPLLVQAAQSPEQWNAALTAAQQAGYDVSTVPQEYDPEWAKGQLMILEAAKDPEKRDRIGKALQAYGYTDPKQPGYAEALQEFTRMSFAKQTVDEYGRQVLVFPEVVPAGQAQPSQPAAQIAAQQPPEQSAQSLSPDQWQANVQSLGLPRAINWAASNGIAIPIQGDSDYAMVPSGAAFVGPDGLMRRKP